MASPKIPVFNKETSPEDLTRASRLSRATAPKLEEVRGRVVDCMNVVESFFLPNQKGADGKQMIDEGLGGNFGHILFSQTTLRKDLETFVAAVEQSLVSQDFMVVFERATLAAIISPSAIAATRLFLIAGAYSEQFNRYFQSLSPDSEDEMEGEFGMNMLGLGLRGHAEEDTMMVKPIICTASGYKYAKLDLSLNLVMGFGYYVGLMLSVSQQLYNRPDTMKKWPQMLLVADFIEEELFNFDFKEVRAYIERVLNDILTSAANDRRTELGNEKEISIAKTLLENSWTSNLRKVVEDVETIYRHITEHPDVTKGMSFELITDVLVTALEVIDARLEKLNASVDSGATSQHLNGLSGAIEELSTLAEPKALGKANKVMNDLNAVIQELSDVEVEDVVVFAKSLSDTKSKMTPEQASAFKKAHAEFEKPLSAEIRKNPKYDQAVKDLAKDHFGGDEKMAESFLTIRYNKALHEMEAEAKESRRKKLIDKSKHLFKELREHDPGRLIEAPNKLSQLADQPWFTEIVDELAKTPKYNGNVVEASRALTQLYIEAGEKLQRRIESNTDAMKLLRMIDMVENGVNVEVADLQITKNSKPAKA